MTTKKLISLPDDLARDIKAAATAEGQSDSLWIQQAAEVRDLGSLESGVRRPRTGSGGEYLYPTLNLAAAAFMEAINQNRPLVDGNKRLSWIGAAAMYALAGHRRAEVPQDDIVTLRLRVAQHAIELEDLAGELDWLLLAD